MMNYVNRNTTMKHHAAADGGEHKPMVMEVKERTRRIKEKRDDAKNVCQWGTNQTVPTPPDAIPRAYNFSFLFLLFFHCSKPCGPIANRRILSARCARQRCQTESMKSAEREEKKSPQHQHNWIIGTWFSTFFFLLLLGIREMKVNICLFLRLPHHPNAILSLPFVFGWVWVCSVNVQPCGPRSLAGIPTCYESNHWMSICRMNCQFHVSMAICSLTVYGIRWAVLGVEALWKKLLNAPRHGGC